MLVLINKYLRSRTNKNDDSQPAAGSKDKQRQQHPIPPPGSDHMCMSGCVPVPAKRGAVTTATTTARTSRHNFVRAAASGLLAGARFTDHESIPSLPDAYAEFAAAFPQYAALASADAVRDREYPHLHRHVCLDYTGINLFSHAQMETDSSSSSSSASSSSAAVAWRPPFFDIAYKSTSLRTQVHQQQCGGRDVGAAITKRIMASLKIPDDEYTMVCTANRTTAFRLLAESYSFNSSGGGNKKQRQQLLTVYDYESEAAGAMADVARRRGARAASATFAWPSMRIHAADLRKKLARGGRRRGGLFVFPLASRMTGARYPYLWMSAAQEQGWHVALDACALGTKDLDTFGVSLLRPDFIVCNFFKVFGQNPSGFAGLFVRNSSLAALERSVIARSIGIVTIVPARRWSLRDRDVDGYSTTTELDRSRSFPKFADHLAADGFDLDDVDTSASFSGQLSSTAITRSRNLHADDGDVSEEVVDAAVNARDVSEEIVEVVDAALNARDVSEEIVEVDAALNARAEPDDETERPVVECRGLDHADALGLIAIGNRLRCISNWLVVAMQKLRHPHAEDDGGHHLVRVYGPRVRFDRGPSLAFNVFDWTGERVAPPLVQKLADRHNISLTCGFLRNIWFPGNKHEADRAVVLDRRSPAEEDGGAPSGKRRKDAAGGGGDVGIFVVNASLGFLSNFEDAYRLWAFVARFLDADFVEKERWRYTALNQRTVEV